MIRSSSSAVCTEKSHVCLAVQTINHVKVDSWTRIRWQDLLLAPTVLFLEGSTDILLACFGEGSLLKWKGLVKRFLCHQAVLDQAPSASFLVVPRLWEVFPCREPGPAVRLVWKGRSAGVRIAADMRPGQAGVSWDSTLDIFHFAG